MCECLSLEPIVCRGKDLPSVNNLALTTIVLLGSVLIPFRSLGLFLKGSLRSLESRTIQRRSLHASSVTKTMGYEIRSIPFALLVLPEFSFTVSSFQLRNCNLHFRMCILFIAQRTAQSDRKSVKGVAENLMCLSNLLNR